MKKTVSLVLALVLLVSIVAVAGAQGTRSTAFQIVNLGTNAADITIYYYNASDGAGGGGTLQCSDSVTALGSFKSVQYNQGGTGSCIDAQTTWQGAVVIESTEPIAVITNVAEPAASNVTYAAGAYDGVADTRTAQEIVFPFVMYDFYGYNTDFAIQNAGSAEATVTLTYYKTGSTAAAKTVQNIKIAPGSSYYRNQKTADTDLGATWSGVVVVSSTQPVAGVVNENPNAGGQILNYEGFPSGGTTVNMPFLCKGFTSLSWYTGFQVVAMADNTVGTIKFYKTGESTPTAEVDLSLSKYGSLEWNMRDKPASDYKNGVGIPDNWSGAGVIELTSGSAVAIVNERGKSGLGDDMGLTYSGFDTGLSKANMTFPFVIKNYYKFYTAFQVVNVGTAGTVTVYYDAQPGSGLNSYTWTSASLATNESLECNQLYGGCIDTTLPDSWVGSVRVVGAAGVQLTGICNERSDQINGDAGLVYNGFPYD